MKKELALLLGVAMLGVATAADVTTANTAVVIRKAPVESDTGYQFLCVPVRGFDITGQGATKGVPLNDVLPPTTAGFSESTSLTIENNAIEEGCAPNTSWKLAKNTAGQLEWVPTTGTGSGTDLLHNGARLWLNAEGISWSWPAFGTETTADATRSETIFCGEQVETEGYIVSNPAVGMFAYGNNTSEPVDIYAIADLQNGDQLLRVQEGSGEYLTYIYYTNASNSGKWILYLPDTGVAIPADASTESTVTAEQRTIAPGEAFYFYRAQ